MSLVSFKAPLSPPFLRLWLIFIVLISDVRLGGRIVAGESNGGENQNPFTPKGFLLRYWKKQITNDLPTPEFLISKASPLTAADYAGFTKIANDQNSLTAHLQDFCAKAKLMCFPDLAPSLEKHDGEVNFANYKNQNFTGYGNNRLGGKDNFQSYTEDGNVVIDTFRRYTHGDTAHSDRFTGYASEANVVDQSFNTYGAAAIGGEGQFTNYNDDVNVPNLRFTSYSDGGNGRKQSFTTYANQANSGNQGFTAYGKNGNSAVNAFTSYGKDSNVMGSGFKNYGESSNGANDTFSSYGINTNVPQNTFQNYGANGNAATETFTNYREQANVGNDTFTSYGKESNGVKNNFINYGKSFSEGTDKFISYGKDATGDETSFKIYSMNYTFKEYNKEGSTTTFASYSNETSPLETSMAASGNKPGVNKWVEPGKFFREALLKKGTIMPMPDIRDKMPRRSFLPRVIVSKFPFSSSKLQEIKKIFHAGDDSSTEKMVTDALHECERAPSPGETKRCVASIEDMIDFATSVLGRSVKARTTETTAGSNGNIMLGEVIGINGGKVTKSVSCHQSLYPYLLYYCHSVPKVRVYEADILDPTTKTKINHGIAICHLDTTSWSADHGAFIALGLGPGKTEVCHWIFENDMTWAAIE